jgi:hypothetical protein
MAAADVELNLNCDNAAAELLVVDSDFRLVAHGAPPLRTRVEPGIYALKAKIGAKTTERLELIEPRAEPYRFELPAPRFESPMPLDGTATSREDQRQAPDQFMRSSGPKIVLDDAIGGISSLVLFVRDTAHLSADLTAEQRELYAKGFEGFRLLHMDGRQHVNFDTEAVKQFENGYLGAQVQLAAGPYVLAWGHDEEQTCLAINAVRGWALQVFLRLQPVGGDPLHLRPAFCDAAFAMDRIDAGYSAAREDFRTMEAARIAMLDRRAIAGGQKMRALLTGRCTNPMLNLYGGHLLVAAPKCDFDLLAQVITNTATVLGSLYPDLVALAWAYESGAGKRPPGFDMRPWPEILAALEGPPLLTPSWDLLLKCAEAASVDIDTLPAFGVAGELAVSGIVLTWERSRRRFERRLRERSAGAIAQPSSTPMASSPVQSPFPSASPLSRASPVISVARAIWHAFVKKPAATVALPAEKPIVPGNTDRASGRLPSFEVKAHQIDSPQEAADVLRMLAKKAPWADLVRLLQRETDLLDNLASFSPLQRDLVATLSRASEEPDVLDGIDAEHVSSIMRAHRVPLTTVAGALRTLDIVAVSTEMLRRVKAVVHSSAGKAKPAASRTQ